MKQFSAITFFVMLVSASSVQAFECPQHFTDAQAAIDQASNHMKAMKGTMDKQEHALVHALIDDAKMLLTGAKHNHEKPQAAYDHARALAKADAATGYAEAADMLMQHYMNK